MESWHLWKTGEILADVVGIEPRLASWDARTHPAQIRLQAYLDDLQARISFLPPSRTHLFLTMDIDVGDSVRLDHHYDLENYLTPVVYRLGGARFTYVNATKRVGGGTHVQVGAAVPMVDRGLDGWQHFSCAVGAGAQSSRWKKGLRDALAATSPRPIPSGPAAVHLAWRCSSRRNWVSLWKPTGDAMGPVLGEPRPFNPNDDRIVELHLHRNLDDAVGHMVDVGMWWRLGSRPEAGTAD